jgi:2-oxo-4-hydroxy-4-carboxy-5-ureidoimidazoline decarboxylase
MDDLGLQRLNALSQSDAIEQFRRCCGTVSWCRDMANARPYPSIEAIHEAADRVMDGMSDDEWREAFACHPRIGDIQSLRMKYVGNREWSKAEQAGVGVADETTLRELAEGNAEYVQKFGFIFIVCATGKSASEMLAVMQSRLQSTIESELKVAAGEQRKITHLRIDKMESV